MLLFVRPRVVVLVPLFVPVFAFLEIAGPVRIPPHEYRCPAAKERSVRLLTRRQSAAKPNQRSSTQEW